MHRHSSRVSLLGGLVVGLWTCDGGDSGGTLGVPNATTSTAQAALGDSSACPADTNIIEGTAGDDTLIGTASNDCVLGYEGNDTLDGGAGDDVLFGGEGDDQLFGGTGADQMYGGPGSDTLAGGNGDDTLHGGDGDDDIEGGNGADAAYGDTGNDAIAGNRGGDTIEGGPGNDVIDGGPGDDVISGGDGDDMIADGGQSDTVDGGAGEDSCSGAGCESPAAPIESRCLTDADCEETVQTCLIAVGICVFCRADSDCDDGDSCSVDECRPVDGCDNSSQTCGVCGDGVVDEGEACDGDNLSGQTCASLGFDEGLLRCNATCDGFNATECSYCGNGTAEGNEVCDGSDLGGATCEDFGMADGVLSCSTNCTFDTSGCIVVATCLGDGVIEPPEQCDGVNLNGATCASLGFLGGTLACGSNCLYDTSYCQSCADCSDCNNQACLADGRCGACVRSSECCAPLLCFGGTCRLF